MRRKTRKLGGNRVAVDIGHDGRASVYPDNEAMAEEAVARALNDGASYDEVLEAMPDTITGTSSDFTGNLEDWEARVFNDAVHFRLHRFYGNGEHDRAEEKDFRKALTLAALELKKGPNHRVMVYAVADTGRWFQIPQDQWLKYLRIWDAKHGTGSKGGK